MATYPSKSKCIAKIGYHFHIINKKCMLFFFYRLGLLHPLYFISFAPVSSLRAYGIQSNRHLSTCHVPMANVMQNPSSPLISLHIMSFNYYFSKGDVYTYKVTHTKPQRLRNSLTSVRRPRTG